MTETTDTQSRRYVLNNTTNDLVNYELRRKMRQVGVQVQDYGLHLCWQSYVDTPGDQLGIGKLVHIAAPADLQGVKEPDAPVMPDPVIPDKPVALRGLALDLPQTEITRLHKIPGGFQKLESSWGDQLPPLQPPHPGYIFDHAEVVITHSDEQWNPAFRSYPKNADEILPAGLDTADVIPTGAPGGTPTERSVRSITVGFDGPVYVEGNQFRWDAAVTVFWKPSQKLMNDIRTTYDAAIKQFTAEKERAFRAALFQEASDRITAASKITQRNAGELREEERIVVYRNLIGDLMNVAGLKDNADPKVRHVFAEIVESMFDIDQMLYFVAPEWWMPRRHSTNENLGIRDPLPALPAQPAPGAKALGRSHPGPGAAATAFDLDNTVDWGGADRPNDYYITGDSLPARLGSSLGGCYSSMATTCAMPS